MSPSVETPANTRVQEVAGIGDTKRPGTTMIRRRGNEVKSRAVELVDEQDRKRRTERSWAHEVLGISRQERPETDLEQTRRERLG